MAAISIDFWSLNAMSRDANRLASQAEDYANNLTRRVANQISSVAGGGSASLNDACYYVQAKVQKLRERKERYANYAKRITALYEKAQRVDRQVKQEIALSYGKFVDAHPNLKVSWWKSVVIGFLVDLKNSNPLYQLIGSGISLIADKMATVYDCIRYWWKCEGGKEMVSFVASVVGVAVAFALFLAALPALAAISSVCSFIVAVAGVIGAAIALVNAAFKVYTHYKSWKSAEKGDNAWSRIYGEQNSASDCIRAHNFGSRAWNQRMDSLAFGLDFTETVCGVIGTVATLGKLASNISAVNNYFKENGGLKGFMREPKWIDKTYQDAFTGKSFTKKVLKVDNNGNVEMKYTPRSVFRGLKAYVTNDSRVTNSGEGLRTMLNKNFKADVKDFKNSFSIQGFKDNFRHRFSESRTMVIFKGNPTGDPNTAAKIENAWKSFAKDYKVTNFKELKNMKNYANIGKTVIKATDRMDNVMNKKVDIGNEVHQKAMKTLIGTSANAQLLDKIGVFKDFSKDKNGKPTGFSKGILGDIDGLLKKLPKTPRTRYPAVSGGGGGAF